MMRKQRGVAIITAVGIAAIVAGLAMFMVWRYSLWFRQVENQHDLAEARSIARAALDFTRMVLRDDGNQNNGADHAQRPWNQPIPNLPVENGSAGGRLSDAQGRFNFNNLINANGARAESEVTVFKRLLASLSLDPELADRLAEYLDPQGNNRPNQPPVDQGYLALPEPYRAAGAPLADVSELARVKGFTPQIIDKLTPFVVAGPIETVPSLNVNFASPQVLAAVIGEQGEAIAQKLVAKRRAQPFTQVNDLRPYFADGTDGVINTNRVGVASTLFFSDVEAQFGRITVRYHALIQRLPGRFPRVLLVQRR
ncbi:type II secretion system minor pseudopilin GspK [Burkholderiaceae bacterium DAT-1]|nr:type II secretion system minor pseudopilin GspK [Burkholderiaceae bacterium DAT-1]